MAGRVLSGRPRFSGKSGPYELLRGHKSGLFVDVGAAAGTETLAALKHNPNLRAFCFEPFPGNWLHLIRNVAHLPNVTIFQEAVAERTGFARFSVPATAVAEGAWKGYEGYSSEGHLISEGGMQVPVARLDDRVHEPILFLKIDVQGQELRVLNGATKCLDRGVRYLHVEFGGRRDVLQFLLDHDYDVYNGPHAIIMRGEEPDMSKWDIVSKSRLSSGRPAYRAWPKKHPEDPEEFCALFRSFSNCSVWTDLIAISHAAA